VEDIEEVDSGEDKVSIPEIYVGHTYSCTSWWSKL